MLFDTSALPDASIDPDLPYADDSVTLLCLSGDGTISQARRFEEKQTLLAVCDAGTLIAIWAQQGAATAYTVDKDRTALRQAMGVHSRTAGRSYHSAPADLEARREREALPFEARPCVTCGAGTDEVCRTQAGGVASHYHRGRDGSTSDTAKVPRSRFQAS